ncbi:endonuclease [Flavobacterium sp.]|uniref:endonuclease n=1 Tax=Flavobacterium sp. TaxID=239 RepID=UPI00286E7C8C|nr:endonuclease [Flavobacterium sp.]
MKKNYLLLFLLSSFLGFAQAGAPATYYNGFNWTSTGSTLKNALATKITSTHTNILSYAQCESALKIVDLDPTDATNTNVLLLYGFTNDLCSYSSESNFGTSTNDNDHRRRHKEADVSAGSMCAWNREHVYAQALGTPSLGQVGAGADAHHLRTCDVDRNANRGNTKFGTGSGNSGTSGSFWYPGDEWKGDVARNMMYLYLRYPTQCLPTGVGTGATVSTDTNMVQLFLQWNAEDPVSEYEDKRNTYLGNISNTYGQGNRNPFIDNPYLATVIWGGPAAENRWPSVLSTDSFELIADINIYPNPSNDQRINIETQNELDNIQVVSINGQIMQQIANPNRNQNKYTLENLPQGFYFLKLSSDTKSIVKKIVIN